MELFRYLVAKFYFVRPITMVAVAKAAMSYNAECLVGWASAHIMCTRNILSYVQNQLSSVYKEPI